MGLNCGCPAGAHLPDLEIAECKESFGQIQKVIFQRIYKSPGVRNTIADLTKKANLATLLSAADGSKIIVSPYIQNPITEPGAARTFGGGNASLGGVEIIIGTEPTAFTGIMYQEKQTTIATMKKYMCEDVGVYLIDENGSIGAIANDPNDPTEFSPIPIGKLFIGDKKLGGFEEPDSNSIEWNFFPNWSDNLVKVEPEDYNPLTDLANVASA